MIQLLATLTLAAGITAAPGAANQRVSDGQLLRFVYEGNYPIGCQDAALATYALRAKPTTDPAQLHADAERFRTCALGPYGQGSDALRNRANFAAASALLLASRYEPAADAVRDAAAAQTLAEQIVGYRRPDGVREPSRNNDPSPLRTDAGRVARDAGALLASAGNGGTPS